MNHENDNKQIFYSRSSGFNPVWDETLVFHLRVPELALIRFLVWDHDPIGRDFIGQRTVSFRSIMTGMHYIITRLDFPRAKSLLRCVRLLGQSFVESQIDVHLHNVSLFSWLLDNMYGSLTL